MRTLLRLTVALSALILLAVPALASAAAKKKPKSPAITLVSPMRAKVGTTLVLRGKNFKRSARGNTVVFRSPGGRSILVKPLKASSKRLVVVVPQGVEQLLSTNGGAPAATRFSIRVLAGKFSRYTSRGLSPVLVTSKPPAPKPKPAPPAPKPATPVRPGPGPGPAPVPPPVSCLQGGDTDGDLLSDTLEAALKTDPCHRDTDRDGVEDGFEYKSAVDLNDDEFQEPNQSLPYPGKRPYPNPLDGGDASTDFDGDSLTSSEEQKLWKFTVANGATATLTPLTYSAGEQYSVATRDSANRRVPGLAATGYDKQTTFLSWATSNGYRNVILSVGPPWSAWYDQTAQSSFGLVDMNRDGSESARESTYYDRVNDGWLSDGERDEDADGLTNYHEAHGPMMGPGWWTSCYSDAQETPFPVAYAGTDFLDIDSDGDGVLDGADDQDHDDIPNVMELSRFAATGYGILDGSCKLGSGAPSDPGRSNVYGRVNPFNPCLPNPRSRTCPDYIESGRDFAPFDDSPNWYSLN